MRRGTAFTARAALATLCRTRVSTWLDNFWLNSLLAMFRRSWLRVLDIFPEGRKARAAPGDLIEARAQPEEIALFMFAAPFDVRIRAVGARHLRWNEEQMSRP